MKKRVSIVLPILLLLLSACGSSKSAAEREAEAAQLRDAIEHFDFTFSATHAHPMRGSLIYLNPPYYDVVVKEDTVKVYLPYYGVAYTAPKNPREGGLTFNSTDFEYQTVRGTRAGNWLTTIWIHDQGRPIILNFNLWDGGSATLRVQDQDRQMISFSGDVGPSAPSLLLTPH